MTSFDVNVVFALFVGFGLLVGLLFGFFGMGGSFLITPALLVLGYEPVTAVGSGLAFVFGTSIVATLTHHDLGQVDYKLGGVMIAGTTVGIELGKRVVVSLQDVGLAETILSVSYIVLLGGVGVFSIYAARYGRARTLTHDIDEPNVPQNVPPLVSVIRNSRLPPTIAVCWGELRSVWTILGVAFVTGLLSGALGVGGGFIRMPALVYLIGAPVPVAVGTDLFEIIFSGGFGSLRYAQDGGVDLHVVVPLLIGSIPGARLGARATTLVDQLDISQYFGLLLLGGALAVGVKELGRVYGITALHTLSFAIIVASAMFVCGIVGYQVLRRL